MLSGEEMNWTVKNNETPPGYKHLGESSSSLVIKEIQTEMKAFRLSH